MSCFSIMDIGDASLVLGMGVTRDREKGTATILQKKPGEGRLNKEEKQRFTPSQECIAPWKGDSV